MTDLRTAAQQALEALEYYRSGEDHQPTPASEAIAALRAALEEPVQEPQRKPLTEDQMNEAYRHIYRNLPYEFDHSTPSWVEQGIRYAERAHGIK